MCRLAQFRVGGLQDPFELGVRFDRRCQVALRRVAALLSGCELAAEEGDFSLCLRDRPGQRRVLIELDGQGRVRLVQAPPPVLRHPAQFLGRAA
jgi:hypothetical protein